MARACTIDGCDNPSRKRGLCHKHYNAAWRAANIEISRERERAYGRANPDKKVAQARAWALANPEKARANKRTYHARHRDKVNAAHAAQRRAHPEKARAATRAWRAANPERWAEVQRLNALRRKSGRDPDAIPYLEHVRHDPCAYCGEPSASIDHIQALARGGSNCWDNLTAACGSCNSRKHAKQLLHFLLS